MLFTWKFWNVALQRSVRTFAQGALSVQTGNMFNIWHADWKQVLGVGLGAAWYSLLMSVDRSETSTNEPTFIVNNNTIRPAEAP